MNTTPARTINSFKTNIYSILQLEFFKIHDHFGALHFIIKYPFSNTTERKYYDLL
jgi:hypothetical protein